jgi:hypothetical protein
MRGTRPRSMPNSPSATATKRDYHGDDIGAKLLDGKTWWPSSPDGVIHAENIGKIPDGNMMRVLSQVLR